jgi:hypothetical protein
MEPVSTLGATDKQHQIQYSTSEPDHRIKGYQRPYMKKKEEQLELCLTMVYQSKYNKE